MIVDKAISGKHKRRQENVTVTTSIEILFEKTGLSVEELAVAAGLTDNRVVAILDGRWLPSPAERRAIAGVFEVAADEINWGHTMSPRNVRYHRFGLKEDLRKKPAREGHPEPGEEDDGPASG